MSCSDVQTIKAGDGSKTQFSFDFPYIFKSEIHVYFWNITTKEWDEKLTTDSTYPWRITDANPTIVEFTSTAPPAPTTPTVPNETAEDNVRIRRITKVDDIRALFNPGSAIRSDDLNTNFEQLRYAIQESNCQGIPDDVDEYLKEYYWDRFSHTLYAADTWRSDDDTIATTAALDARFQDEVNDTFTKSELAANSDVMPDNDNAVPTTGAVDNYINKVLTNDIGGSNGVTITDDGDGTITVGLSDDSIDFDKIKDADQIKLADQVADSDVVGTDNNIFTAQAATRRFSNYYQNDAPSTTDGIGIGQVWVDPNDDLTLSVWTGSAWSAVTSGGTFANQPKVIYVDSAAGDDNNDGHRISRPKKTIKAALSDINGDSSGDGSIISVAPGIYAETLPLDIEKNDVGIIGQSLRTCIIHPLIPEADRDGYSASTPHSQELQTMFRVNSGSYFQNLTLMGLKASGTRGDSGSLYEDSTYGLPPNQGWNFAFYPNATIKKSPYIQNCTNFSDSLINNHPDNFTPHVPGEGAAGDNTSGPTGGGILVDGSVPHTDSPLRSIVADSYTHTALDGPGILVTNNGYAQCTSSYAFFNHAHITCLNGGQANLAASTSDFGRFALIADGKSSTAIFTSNVDGAASDGSTTFNINAPAAQSGWFGNANRPANNMLVTVNSVTYPVLSAVPRTDSEGGVGFTVTISRPSTTDRSNNLGLNGAVSDNASVSFFLRSMIASSGHTMEYVGSGTDYDALPENGGVPNDNNQIIERNDGKVWTATTDHKGTFKVGDFFTVDQSAGTLSVDSGSFKVDLGTLNLNNAGDAAVGADIDMGSNQITASGSNNLKLNAAGSIDVQNNKIINVTDPADDKDAANKKYVDANTFGAIVEDDDPTLGANLDVDTYSIITSSDNRNVTINPHGTGSIELEANTNVDGDLGVTGNATVTGNLTVNGTTTTINSTTLQVDDKNIELGTVGTPTDATADGGGITLKGATDKTFNWVNSTDSWTSSEHIELASGKEFRINGNSVLSNDTLGSGVTGSSLTSVGTIATGTWEGTAIATDYIADDAVTADKLANTTVTAGSYTAADITVDAQGRITAAASGTIGTAEIADDAVTTDQIADDAVTTAQIADTTIVDGNVSATAAIAGTKINPNFGNQDLTVDTNVFHVDAADNRVGIGTSTPAVPLHLTDDDVEVARFVSTSDGAGPELTFEHAGDSPADNDVIGQITFEGRDGNGNAQDYADIRIISTTVAHEGEDGAISFRTSENGTLAERLRIASDGTLQLDNSTGIDFSGIQNNSGAMTSETLDSYEEGTWTPAPAFGGTTTNVAGTFQGNYTRVGRLVTVFCSLQFTNNGTGTGANTISGLPFAVADSMTGINGEFSGSVGFFANGGDRERATYGIVALSGTDDCQIYGGSNANHADLDVAVDEGTIVNNSSIRFTLQYIAA